VQTKAWTREERVEGDRPDNSSKTSQVIETIRRMIEMGSANDGLPSRITPKLQALVKKANNGNLSE